jgi:hypothetical protein
MTTITSPQFLRAERLAGASSVAIAAGALAVANFAGAGSGGTGPYVASLVAVAIVSGVVFGRVLPNAGNLGRTAWILAGLAAVTCAVFWTGLPIVLGIGAISAGWRADRPGPVALGFLATVAGVVACVIG